MSEVKIKILIIEDENRIRFFMRTMLEYAGYDVLTAATGREGIELINSHCPNVVLLDLGLPDMDGIEVVKSLRKWSSMPVIVVSARGEEKDKVAALDAGADDYISKPFGKAELLARIKVALRHAAGDGTNPKISPEGQYEVGDMVIDFAKCRVTIGGRDAELTQNEYKIVSLLGKFAGRVLTYDYIIQQLWGPNARSDNQILRVNMANIRRKIEKRPAEPRYILTEVGVGYRMAEK